VKNKILAAAFLEGFFLLGIEILYTQLLKPYYGDSYYVWLTMLSVTMLGSTAGYYAGGAIAKGDPERTKKFLLLDLALLTLFFANVYPISEGLFLTLFADDFIKSVIIHSFIILFLPVVAITLFNPLLVKAYDSIHQHSGKSSGTVFFASTCGGVVSVYLVAFFLLPRFDLLDVIAFFTTVLVMAFAAYLFATRQYRILALQVIASSCIIVFFVQGQALPLQGKNTRVLHRSHGVMGEIEIREEGKSRFMSLNRTPQSAIDPNTGVSRWSYPYRVSNYASALPERARVLVAGLGGGVLVNQLMVLNFDIDCVEFDYRTYDLSRKYMHLAKDFTFIVDDFRHFVNATDKSYDLIILDLSKGESIPTNVYTVEAFEKILSLLNRDGYMMLHYFSDVFGKGDYGLKSIMKTLSRTGAFFSLIRKIPGDKSAEQIVIAANNPELIGNRKFRFPERLSELHGFPVTDYYVQDLQFEDGEVLTDEKNNLDRVQFGIVEDIRNHIRTSEKSIFYER
jgi:spermidine synthase